MRKIAANYILLPGFEFVKNGYVVLKDGKVMDVVNTGGEIREIPCLEFYGGMIVDDCVRQCIKWVPGEPGKWSVWEWPCPYSRGGFYPFYLDAGIPDCIFALS